MSTEPSKNVFAINPPQDLSETKYILSIYRSGGGMFGGSRPTVVAVDRLEPVSGNAGQPHLGYRGYKGDKLVVEFPASYTYLLVASELVEAISSIEHAKRTKAEHEELDKIFGPSKEEEGLGDLELTHPGRYV
jgi:hypothetical protein